VQGTRFEYTIAGKKTLFISIEVNRNKKVLDHRLCIINLKFSSKFCKNYGRFSFFLAENKIGRDYFKELKKIKMRKNWNYD